MFASGTLSMETDEFFPPASAVERLFLVRCGISPTHGSTPIVAAYRSEEAATRFLDWLAGDNHMSRIVPFYFIEEACADDPKEIDDMVRTFMVEGQ